MTPPLEIARREWEDAHAALERESRDRTRYERLLVQVEVLVAELRRRLGQTFTLQELTVAYADADRWARDAVSDHAASPGWPRDLSLVAGAAFHAYARGAVDYDP
jgi:alcohol dehydrogenase class IV